MSSYKDAFLDAAIANDALTFGSFTLKSGRKSPYFFNMGKFCTGKSLSQLAEGYAHTIIESPIQFDVLFGPAYKGIPLAAAVLTALYRIGGEKYADVEYSFNRKEKKDHGEGGSIVGADLKGKKVLIIDDVMTAGTAINEAFDIIDSEKGIAIGCIIALDRQETVKDSDASAAKTVSKRHGVPVLNIVDFDDIIKRMQGMFTKDQLVAVHEYRDKYVPKD